MATVGPAPAPPETETPTLGASALFPPESVTVSDSVWEPAAAPVVSQA